ncbi:hypothetical protein ACBP93_00970 [Paenalcaligenes hominis]|uniref:AbrB/MazE/SpoVT family DNA-binding domain-containing protein n=1 Tax=Paenalcaligenes hominis TaxID=643674 RepID=UPI003525ACC1
MYSTLESIDDEVVFTLPDSFVQAHNLKEGDVVNAEIQGNTLILSVNEKPTTTIKQT